MLYDDRKQASPGVKFKDAELIGHTDDRRCGAWPLGRNHRDQDRRSGERREVAVGDAVAQVLAEISAPDLLPATSTGDLLKVPGDEWADRRGDLRLGRDADALARGRHRGAVEGLRGGCTAYRSTRPRFPPPISPRPTISPTVFSPRRTRPGGGSGRPSQRTHRRHPHRRRSRSGPRPRTPGLAAYRRFWDRTHTDPRSTLWGAAGQRDSHRVLSNTIWTRDYHRGIFAVTSSTSPTATSIRRNSRRQATSSGVRGGARGGDRRAGETLGLCRGPALRGRPRTPGLGMRAIWIPIRIFPPTRWSRWT